MAGQIYSFVMDPSNSESVAGSHTGRSATTMYLDHRKLNYRRRAKIACRLCPLWRISGYAMGLEDAVDSTGQHANQFNPTNTIFYHRDRIERQERTTGCKGNYRACELCFSALSVHTVARPSADCGEVRTQSQRDGRGVGEATAQAPGGTPMVKGTERQCSAERRQSVQAHSDGGMGKDHQDNRSAKASRSDAPAAACVILGAVGSELWLRLTVAVWRDDVGVSWSGRMHTAARPPNARLPMLTGLVARGLPLRIGRYQKCAHMVRWGRQVRPHKSWAKWKPGAGAVAQGKWRSGADDSERRISLKQMRRRERGLEQIDHTWLKLQSNSPGGSAFMLGASAG
ncbi:hypothetical protein B0H13DRAFT_2408838 [Mycena leptocephala]|nr:hypothetical protein B0H13DRAFT_2408838 [Mycena leptocephala]